MRICIFILGSLLFFWPSYVGAAELFVRPSSYVENGEKFYEIRVFLNTQGEDVNALEGKMSYKEQDFVFKKTRTGGSIISFWLKSPDKTSGGEIIFSGGIPGGYDGGDGFLFSTVFKLVGDRYVDSSKIWLQDIKIYLNDGLGTEKTEDASEKIIILEKVEIQNPISDNDPPEPFLPYLIQDPDLENGKWVVMLDANDKGEGMSHYEIYESDEEYGMEEIVQDGSIPWSKADDASPYFLLGQNLKNYIYVKAVDKAGNERIVIINPVIDDMIKNFDDKLISGIIILLIITSVAIFEIFYMRRLKQKKF